MGWRLRYREFMAALFVGFCLLAGACSGGSGSGSGGEATAGEIVVGSKSFTENQILGEIYAQALEGAGFKVRHRSGLGSLNILGPALKKGEVNFVPEYVGNSLSFFSSGKIPPTSDGEKNRQELAAVLEPDGIAVLNMAPGQDQNAFAVTSEQAKKHSLKTVSDLKPIAPEWVFGGPPDCPQREDCLKGLEDVYGLHFKAFRSLDVGGPLTIIALVQDEIQLALLFSTSPFIQKEDLVVLEDSKGIVAAENVVPLVRDNVLDDKLTSVVNAVSAQITTDALIEMNSKVDLDGEDPAVVAREFLKSNGLG